MRQVKFEKDVSLFCGLLATKYNSLERKARVSSRVNSFECYTKAVKFKSVVGSFRLSTSIAGPEL